MMIVCNLVQYPTFNGKVSKEQGRVEREGITILKTDFEIYNEEHTTTQYIEDVKATKAYMKLWDEAQAKRSGQFQQAEEKTI